MVQDALNAFAARDAELAIAVVERDTVVDDFYNSVFRTLVTFMVENPKTISECAHLLFIARSEEHTSELQSLMRISYAVFCLKKKNRTDIITHHLYTTTATYNMKSTHT